MCLVSQNDVVFYYRSIEVYWSHPGSQMDHQCYSLFGSVSFTCYFTVSIEYVLHSFTGIYCTCNIRATFSSPNWRGAHMLGFGASESELYSGKSTSSLESFMLVLPLELSSELSSWRIGMMLAKNLFWSRLHGSKACDS